MPGIIVNSFKWRGDKREEGNNYQSKTKWPDGVRLVDSATMVEEKMSEVVSQVAATPRFELTHRRLEDSTILQRD